MPFDFFLGHGKFIQLVVENSINILDGDFVPALRADVLGEREKTYILWPQRAKTVGYPERFAQEALGHNSKAVHRANEKRALMKIPSLEDYERQAAVKVAPVA
jgi:hypothetical protein